jgi:multidrug transporter EmrE-like cation transporter
MRWVYVAATILLTVYGQLVVKWQVGQAGAFPEGVSDKVTFLVRLVVNPWVISVLLAAFLAALSWMAAMTQLDLSRAYPFIGLSFVLVLLLSGVFFGETITLTKMLGASLIVAGLVVGAQS